MKIKQFSKKSIVTGMLILSIVFGVLYFANMNNQNLSDIKTNQTIQQKQEDYRYLIKVDNKYGYINYKGEVIIEPKFDDAKDFSEGLAAVKIKNKWGFIDKSGKLVIKPKFDYVYSFSEGLALVSPDYLNKYFINKQGKIQIENKQIQFGYSFSDGLAYGFYFEEGEEASDNVVFIDHKGNIKINLAKTGLYNCEDELICKSFSQEFLGVNDRKFYLEKNINKWGFINKNGIKAVALNFDYVFDFSEDLAAVELNNKYGFINKNGDIIIDLKFEDVKSFSEGLAPVKKNNKWGFINKKGIFVINPKFDCAKSFTNNIAAVLIEKRWGYIDEKGDFLIKPCFYEADLFKNGLAKVMTKNGKFYINKKGDFIWSNIMNTYSKGQTHLSFNETNNDELNKYLQMIIGKINENWNPPKSFKYCNLTVVFSVDKNGYPNDIQINNHSEENMLHNYVVKVLKQSAPFVPVPKGLNVSEYKISITVKFSEFLEGSE